MPAQREVMLITNTESKEMSVCCLFESQPHLSVQFEACLVSSEEPAKVVFEFRPREAVKYAETVTFEINGFFQKSVTIRGEGSRMRIELANPAQKIVNLGALQLGDRGFAQASRTVKVVNHSPSMLKPTLTIVPSSSIPALQEEGVLTVHPAGELTLKANGGTCDVVVSFMPTSRVPQFTEEVTLECQGSSQPLFVVSGSCHGLQVALDLDYVPFGAVVQDTSSVRKILMINSGDIGAAFRWKLEDFGPHFSIAPKEGYISPGMQVIITITAVACRK